MSFTKNTEKRDATERAPEQAHLPPREKHIYPLATMGPIILWADPSVD